MSYTPDLPPAFSFISSAIYAAFILPYYFNLIPIAFTLIIAFPLVSKFYDYIGLIICLTDFGFISLLTPIIHRKEFLRAVK